MYTIYHSLTQTALKPLQYPCGWTTQRVHVTKALRVQLLVLWGGFPLRGYFKKKSLFSHTFFHNLEAFYSHLNVLVLKILALHPSLYVLCPCVLFLSSQSPLYSSHVDVSLSKTLNPTLTLMHLLWTCECDKCTLYLTKKRSAAWM